MNTFMGIEITPFEYATQRVADWSRCRSPSRARRRYAQGHRQRVVWRDEPVALLLAGKIFAHPVVIRNLELATTYSGERIWPGVG